VDIALATGNGHAPSPPRSRILPRSSSSSPILTDKVLAKLWGSPLLAMRRSMVGPSAGAYDVTLGSSLGKREPYSHRARGDLRDRLPRQLAVASGRAQERQGRGLETDHCRVTRAGETRQSGQTKRGITATENRQAERNHRR
jgi:hypothetical protein